MTPLEIGKFVKQYFEKWLIGLITNYNKTVNYEGTIKIPNTVIFKGNCQHDLDFWATLARCFWFCLTYSTIFTWLIGYLRVISKNPRLILQRDDVFPVNTVFSVPIEIWRVWGPKHPSKWYWLIVLKCQHHQQDL